jgi:autophagy-related protein 17
LHIDLHPDKSPKSWDIKRKERTTALDFILDDLGSQLVPPSFYEDASGSSLFGSHPSLKDPSLSMEPPTNETPHKDDGAITKDMGTRMKWKSLRFFVDERAIEEAIERMDEDRSALEVSHDSIHM